MGNRTVNAGLRCLAHPVTLAAIGLLLLNDHVLKAAAPSWVTGKLSDVAGLFFFPFLVITALAPVLGRAGWGRQERLAWGAFVLTAAWFAAAKTLPFANQATEHLAGWLLGEPVVVLIDPTDLVALAALWPAWRLWSLVSEQPDAGRAPVGLRWLALGVATMATAATSYAPPLESVQRIIVDGRNTVALVKCYERDCDNWAAYRDNWAPFRGAAEGNYWSFLGKSEGQALAQAYPAAQTYATDPRDPRRRYRIVPRTDRHHPGRVDVSEDGGATWAVAWELPPGRFDFMERYNDYGPLKAENHDPEMGPYELAFTPDGSGTLVVALGNQGVLRKDADGGWHWERVGTAEPTPLATTDPREWLAILFPELIAALVVFMAGSFCLSLFGWFPIHSRRTDVKGLIRPAVWTFVVAFLLACALLYVEYWWLLAPLAAFVLACAAALLWIPAVRAARDSDAAHRARWGCFWLTFPLGIAAALPFVLWGAGIVPWYAVAIVLAVVLALLALGFGAFRVFRLARETVEQTAPLFPGKDQGTPVGEAEG